MTDLLVQPAPRLRAQDWSLLDEAVEGLEQAWRTTHSGDIARFVPPAGHAVRGRVLVELIKVDQEYRWAAGQKRLLEAYLADWPELRGTPHVVRELLEAECLTRAIFDSLPTIRELASRFPEISGQIDLAAIVVQVERERDHG